MDRFAQLTCIQHKRDGHFQNISYHQFKAYCLRLAHFLVSEGISPGERIVLIANNSPEWLITHTGCLLAGGVVVPLRTTHPPEILGFIIRDCAAARVVVDDAELMSRVVEADPELTRPQTLAISPGGTWPASADVNLTDVLALPLGPDAEEAILTYANSIEPDALASIFYGTNEAGHPRGAMFSQAQRLLSITHMAGWFTLDIDDLAYTILPWGAAASLNATLHYFLSGTANVLATYPAAVEQDLQQTSPTVTLNTPYFIERTYEEIMLDVSQMPQAYQEIFRWAVAKGQELRAAGSTAAKEMRERYFRTDLTFFNHIRGRIGGRLRRLYSVDAPLPQALAEFLEVIGLNPLGVYSTIEAGGFPAVSGLTTKKPGSCGQVAPGFQISIAEDGEVLVKGPTVMQGYWQRPAETRQMVDESGWLHTGDLGSLDDDNYLYLSGRKQATILLSTGRKVVPSIIERALTDSPLIASAAVFGEGQPFVSALISPNLTALANLFKLDPKDEAEPEAAGPASNSALDWYWQQANDRGSVMTTMAHPTVKQLLDKAVREVNLRLDRQERVQAYHLLSDTGSPTTSDLTAPVPLDRHLVAERLAVQIEAMYPRVRQIDSGEISRVQLPPERLRELLEKEKILDAWLADAGLEFLFELAREKQIDVPSIVHICDTAAGLAQMVNEDRPLSTAIIVGDPVRVARVLPASQIQLLRHDHIRRTRHVLVNLAKMVDGLVLGFVVDKHGYLRGVHKLTVPLEEQPSTYLMGPQFRRHAAISWESDAVVFYVPTGGKQVRIFANGELVGRYSNGDWTQESMFRVADGMAKLIEQKNYDLPLVRRLLRCAFDLSERNLGALIVLGDADRVLEYSDAPEISHFASIVGADVSTLTDEELVNFAKQDGATVIDIEGRFRGCMVLLRPDSNTPAEIGPGKGARHSSAAKMSAEAECLAITVSQDGPITIYESGQQVFSF
jgi:long-chain acyl-CoA synthetase